VFSTPLDQIIGQKAGLMAGFEQLQSRHVVVMGVAGAGNSTVGRRLAERLGMDYANADDFHAADASAKLRRA
jgi:cytidylate kinase